MIMIHEMVTTKSADAIFGDVFAVLCWWCIPECVQLRGFCLFFNKFLTILVDKVFQILLSSHKFLEPGEGVEPSNKGFADLCLTTWLTRLRSAQIHEPTIRSLNEK